MHNDNVAGGSDSHFVQSHRISVPLGQLRICTYQPGANVAQHENANSIRREGKPSFQKEALLV